jgi:uncharacterized damage-inducible protein DinB
MIFKETKHVLCQLIDGISQLDYDQYTNKGRILYGSSIGSHTRHVIELYQQLLGGYENGVVDYDNRQRNILIEESVDVAIESIANIISQIDKADKPLYMHSIYFREGKVMESTYYRELLYNIEHCIHHQAIIKIAFEELGCEQVAEDFGVAKSTLEYREKCAQ